MTVQELARHAYIVRLIHEEARGEGLTGKDAEALLAIAAHPGQTSDVIERALGMMNTAQASSFRRSHQMLVELRLVERTLDRRAGRRATVPLTVYGEATAKRIAYRVGRRLSKAAAA